jgi:hypothetical protein
MELARTWFLLISLFPYLVRTSNAASSIEYPKMIDSPTHYPLYKPLLDIIREWNPDDPEIPSSFTETLQHFNYSCPVEREIAAKFRDAEVPFKLYDIPNVNEVSLSFSFLL